MIALKRDGTNIVANIEGAYRVFSFSWNAGVDWAAELLLDDFNRTLCSLMKDIREEEYTRGWNDARRKNTKKSWFSTALQRGRA